MVRQACAGLLYKPGRGKTSVVLMAHRILQEMGYVNRMLVICPIRPMYRVWPNQPHDYAEFDHLRVGVLHGKNKDEVLANAARYDILVINPDGLEWLLGATVIRGGKGNKVVLDPARVALVQKLFDVLVVDESTKFKNSQTNRFKMLRQFVKFFKRRYIMTGSPMPKGLMDLFGQIYILDEGSSLGEYITHYRKKFFYPSGYGGYEWSPKENAKDQILERIGPLVQVVDEAPEDLPKLLPNDIWVELPPDVRRMYDEMEEKMLTDGVVAANAAVASSKCRQICNGGLFYGEERNEHGELTQAAGYKTIHDLKKKALEDLLEELAGNPVLITYEFQFDRKVMEEMGIPCISTGNAKHDSSMIDKFSRGEVVAVCGHPQSISLGIDGLQQHCRDICMYGINWSLENYEQVIDRVRRSGNPNDTVTLHRILVLNSVDERVVKVIDKRDSQQVDFLKALRTYST
jgi:hypothetical protein